jgi:hypothetical protein
MLFFVPRYCITEVREDGCGHFDRERPPAPGTRRRRFNLCRHAFDGIIRTTHWRDESVPFARQCLDEARLFGGISERFSQMVDRFVQTPIEIDKRAGAPETSRQFFAGQELTGLFQECQQELKGLIAERRSLA